jgi:sugar/nucleoside kinase (ribokinase family)
VTVSANRSETEAIAAALTGGAAGDLETDARDAREALGVDRFVGHSASQTTTVSGDGSVSVAVPTTDSPTLTTSAGDHFNVGLLVGHLAGLSAPAATVVANAAAGVFVRTGSPPGYDDIRAFIDGYLEAL